MSLQIVKPSALKYCKTLIFSPPGNGKTTLLGTAQEDERTAPMLLMDFEGGTESLDGLDIDVAVIRSWSDYEEAYEMLMDGNHGYKSLGIDSISETHIFALLNILEKEGPTRKDPELLEQRDYGKATVQMRKLLRSFRDIPMHVFFTAHSKEVELPRQGRVQLPSLAGQMAEEVVGLMSVVGYLAEFEEANESTNEAEVHRTLLLKNFPKFRTKARTPWRVDIADEIIDPTITDLLDALGYPMPDDTGEKAKPTSTRRQTRTRKAKEVTEEEAASTDAAEENAGNEAEAEAA
jgi:AAA domain-containing protein